MKMRLSNLPDDVTDRMIEGQSADACEKCSGKGYIQAPFKPHQMFLKVIECEHCNGSGVEPKRFSNAKSDSWED